jgi:hypothetical protein
VRYQVPGSVITAGAAKEDLAKKEQQTSQAQSQR